MSAPIFFLDPFLKDLEGHRFTYALRLCEAAARQNAGMTVVGSSEALGAVKEQLPFAGAFCPPKSAPIEGLGLGRVLNALANRSTVAKLAKSLSPGLIFLEDVARIYSPAFREWLLKTLAGQGTSLALMLRYPCFKREGELLPCAELYSSIFADCKTVMARGAQIALVTDTPCLKRQFESLTDLPITVLPTLSDPAFQQTPQARPPGQPLRVVHLGVAAEVKGFPQLVDALFLLQARGLLNRFRFSLHTYTAGYKVPLIEDCIRRLESLLPTGALELIPDALSGQDYRRLFLSGQAVALPYEKNRYQASSAIFTEAMTAAIPVLTTEGTWMAAELGPFQCGKVIADNSPETIVQGLLDLEENYPAYLEASNLAAPPWLAFHNADQLVRMLLGLHRPQATLTR